MLSLFPELYIYQQLAPFILRVTLAIILFVYTYRNYKNPEAFIKTISFIKGASAILLILGLFIQLTAIIVALVSFIEKLRARTEKEDFNAYGLRLLIFSIAIALLFLGPGAFSIDLPL